jgi:hypothetical protein
MAYPPCDTLLLDLMTVLHEPLARQEEFGTVTDELVNLF